MRYQRRRYPRPATRLMQALLATLMLAACGGVAARGQTPIGGYYLGKLGADSVTIDLQIYQREGSPGFICEIFGSNAGRINLDGSYRGGAFRIENISRDYQKLVRLRPGASLRLRGSEGEKIITGTLPDAEGTGRVPLTGRLVADMFAIDRSLPNEGRFTATYPIFVGGPRRLLSSIDDPIRACLKSSIEQIDKPAQDDYSNDEIYYDLTISIGTYSPELITLMADRDVRYNGGHSFAEYEGLNFVREGDTMRRIYLRDLFLPGSGYQARLRRLAGVRADSIARILYAESPEVFETFDDPPDSIAFSPADTLDEAEDYLASFTMDLTGGLWIVTPCNTRYPIVQTVRIDAEEIRDLVDPKGPLTRFLSP